MQITLDTKFNIGDVVYFIEYYDGYYATNGKPHLVEDIAYSVKYGLHYNLGAKTRGVDEQDLFATESEARAECERINKIFERGIEE